jgi:hypothetical protein
MIPYKDISFSKVHLFSGCLDPHCSDAPESIVKKKKIGTIYVIRFLSPSHGVKENELLLIWLNH